MYFQSSLSSTKGSYSVFSNNMSQLSHLVFDETLNTLLFTVALCIALDPLEFCKLVEYYIREMELKSNIFYNFAAISNSIRVGMTKGVKRRFILFCLGYYIRWLLEIQINMNIKKKITKLLSGYFRGKIYITSALQSMCAKYVYYPYQLPPYISEQRGLARKLPNNVYLLWRKCICQGLFDFE